MNEDGKPRRKEKVLAGRIEVENHRRAPADGAGIEQRRAVGMGENDYGTLWSREFPGTIKSEQRRIKPGEQRVVFRNYFRRSR